MQKVMPMTRYVAYDRSAKGLAFLAFKRTADIVMALLLLAVLSPLMLITLVIAALDSKGSPVFKQKRMGRNNIPFVVYKFRTMRVGAPANVATHQLNDADSYITKVGHILRKLSLDELPQLVNIIKGDMSFVGPRPVVLSEVDLLTLRERNGANTVRPGLTGWAQVNGRDNVTVERKARMDAYYARHMSVGLDLRIWLRTVGYVLRSQGISEGANPEIAAKTFQKTERSA